MRFFLLFLALLCTIACNAQYSRLVNKTYGERAEAINDLFYINDEFNGLDSLGKSREISKLEQAAQDNDDDELLFTARLMRVTLFRVNYDNDSICLNKLLELLRIAKKKEYKGFAIEVHSFLTGYYNRNHEYTKAIEHEISYKNLLKELSLEEFPLKSNYADQIGGRYYGSGDYEGGKQYLFEAEKNTPSPKATLGDVGILNTLGLIYRKQGIYDSAHYYFKKAILLTKDSSNTLNNRARKRWSDILGGNIGITYYLQKNYAAAQPLLKQDVETSLIDKDYKNAINSMIYLADIHRLNGDYVQSLELTDQARELIYVHDIPSHALASLYRLKAKLLTLKGNVSLSNKYLDSALNAQDSSILREVKFSKSRTRNKLITEEYKHKLSEIEYQRKINVQERNTLIIGLGLLMLVSVLVLAIQRLRHNRLKVEKELADSKLSNAKKRLKDFTKTIHEKNTLLEITTTEIDRLHTIQSSDDEEAQSIELLQQLEKTTILTDEEWDEFKDMFEQVHSGFLHRSKEKLPNLTPAETRFIALTKLQFSNKEIAGVLGISPSTARTYKYRLSKKLNLQEDENLSEIIENI